MSVISKIQVSVAGEFAVLSQLAAVFALALLTPAVSADISAHPEGHFRARARGRGLLRPFLRHAGRQIWPRPRRRFPSSGPNPILREESSPLVSGPRMCGLRSPRKCRKG